MPDPTELRQAVLDLEAKKAELTVSLERVSKELDALRQQIAIAEREAHRAREQKVDDVIEKVQGPRLTPEDIFYLVKSLSRPIDDGLVRALEADERRSRARTLRPHITRVVERCDYSPEIIAALWRIFESDILDQDGQLYNSYPQVGERVTSFESEIEAQEFITQREGRDNLALSFLRRPKTWTAFLS